MDMKNSPEDEIRSKQGKHVPIIIAAIVGVILLCVLLFVVVVPNIKDNNETDQSPSAAVWETEAAPEKDADDDDAQESADRSDADAAPEADPEAQEPAASEPESSETEKAKKDPIPDGPAYRLVDVDSLNSSALVDNGIICSSRYIDDTRQAAFDFIDINKNEILGTVILPGRFYGSKVYASGKGYLAKIVSQIYDYDNYTSDYSVAVVHDDFSVDIIENADAAAVSFEHYGHKIARWGTDIVCVDNGFEVIVPGHLDKSEYGFGTRTQIYMFPIDENRFVYRTAGFEATPGFGIYDFTTGTANFVPDSEYRFPMAVHKGKIYSSESYWDGYGSKLYTTDINTLETEFFMDFPFTASDRANFAYVTYYMPENGRYIAAVKDGYKVDKAIYLINPDSAEIVAAYDVPSGMSFYGSGFFTDSVSIALDGYYNNSEGLIVFDIRQFPPYTAPENEPSVTSQDSDVSFYDVYDYGYVSVDSEFLNVRSGPSTNDEKIGSLADGAMVYIYFYYDGWYSIYYENDGYELYGYVSSEFVKMN